MSDVIYFDYNASAPMLPPVREALGAAFELVGNPSSVHQLGRKCRFAIDKARRQIGEAVDADPKDITFTSGGTEANHLALFGLRIPVENMYSTAVEHASVYKNIVPVNLMPVDEQGKIKLDVLRRAFQSTIPPKLLSVGLANSETGIVQNLAEVIDMCHQNGCLVHTDAVQALGKIPVSFSDLGVDLMTIAAHKIGGPKGVGALITKPKLILKAKYLGGGQEKGLRSGTENIPAIVGFGAAAELVEQINWAPVRQLIKELMEELRRFNAEIRINSLQDGLPNTLNFSTPGYNKETQVIHFDLNGIAVSSGSACSSGKVERSHVLQAMGIEGVYVNSAIRVSLSPTTYKDEVVQFIDAWKAMQRTQKVEGL
ncbi:MAG: cysteine desulfurase [Candidatus Paracaedibacteraceae bacterium]|nr:cysteine desulfurase [Candidatus Paracaedibacteraceae bacterium]